MTARNWRLFDLRAALTCLLLALVAVLGLAHSDPAQADSIPADPAAHGFVGLCGVDGNPMTGGSIHDQPFVWKAISSQRAPVEARGEGAVATLYAVQLRPGVAAYDWNGNQLTATDPYSTPNAPTAQSSRLDYPFSTMVKDYPPLVDGLYELRLYLGNSQNTGFTDQYPATFIKVSGDRWSVVKGGTVDCSQGKAVSTEITALNRSKAAGTPSASAPFGGPSGTGVPKNSRGIPLPAAESRAGTTPSAESSGQQSGGGNSSTTGSGKPSPAGPTGGGGLSAGMTISAAPPGSTSGVADSTEVSSASSSGTDSSATWIVVLVMVVTIVAAGGGWFLYRRLRT